MGENDVGKSSVIKSLYWAFGTEPTNIHSRWKEANIKALVTFTIDDDVFSILRSGNTISVFNSDDDLLISTSSIMGELSPFLSKMLDFHLVFTNRSGRPEIPPPAFAFLPFYIDQDGGWKEPLNSFKNLGQYSNFRKPLLEFHTGILPNEYYTLSAQKKQLQIQQKDLENDRRVVEKAVGKISAPSAPTNIELSIAAHEENIERLLRQVQSLRDKRQQYSKTMTDILDKRIILQEQFTIIKGYISETTKDLTFASSLPEKVFCPTCATPHSNNFANRYAIIDDREACLDFLLRSQEEVHKLALEAKESEAKLRSTDHELNEIENTLESKRGDVTLKEVIESESRTIAVNLFTNQIRDLDTQIGEKLHEVGVIEKKIEELNDKNRRKKIVSYYTGFMVKYLEKLDVVNYNYEDISNIPAKISETGSDQPRAILCYFLSIAQTIHEFSTSIFAPLIIDSPNQQDQDIKNVGSMIDLIIQSAPQTSQTIMGTVSLHGREIKNGKVITFKEKLSVLNSEDFNSVSLNIGRYLQKIIAS